MKKSVERVCKIIVDLYNQSFAGKDDGRFKVTREQMASVFGTFRLNTVSMKELDDMLLEYNIIMIDLDQYFCFIEINKVLAWRQVPKKILEDASV